MDIEFPVFLPFKNEKTYCIEGYIDDTRNFKIGKGYIDKKSGKIYICENEISNNTDIPLLIVKDNKVSELINSRNESVSKIFSVENLYSLSFDNIVESTNPDDQLYDEKALMDMNSSTKVFVPIINQRDDSLKKLIKKSIIEKGIDINRLKHRMPKKYGLPNIKSILTNKTKMSIDKFNIWAELLGLRYEVIVYDNGSDGQDPLKTPLKYDSQTDTVVQFTENDLDDEDEDDDY